jgi:hypothetical protein
MQSPVAEACRSIKICYLITTVVKIRLYLLGKNPPIVARQRLGRNVTAVTKTHTTIEELLDPSFSMWPCPIKESRRFVLLRTSCLMLIRGIIAVYSDGYPKHTNTIYRENAEIVYVKASSTQYPL